MSYVPRLKEKYKKDIVPALMKEFGYSSLMQAPRLEKICLNQGVGQAISDKKLVETFIEEMSLIAGQKAITAPAKKDISNFKLRKGVTVGVKVTLRGDKMYEFLDRLISVALPRIRDFKGVSKKLDGRGNYNLGIPEQIVFPEIEIDKIKKMNGMDITFVTSAQSDEEGHSLLKGFGIPFKS
jgi:large subunit ribosomal protein L5